MDLEQFSFLVHRLQAGLSERILGQERVIQQVLITVLCQGHALITGAPGVAKTMMVRSLAGLLGVGWKRVQFTPDLTPFDILGGEVLRPGANGHATLEFVPGPVFTPFLLADEINRASPRTQAALLEAMQERQVTVSGVPHGLPAPFFVFATQNPIENEGTFPLPEAQLDRFLLNISMGYPDFESELKVVTLPSLQPDPPALDGASGVSWSGSWVAAHPVQPGLLEAVVRLIRNTRVPGSEIPFVQNYVQFGAGPRASQALLAAARARAFLEGPRCPTEIRHVFEMALPVLSHRIILNHKAFSDKITVENVVETLVRECLL